MRFDTVQESLIVALDFPALVQVEQMVDRLARLGVSFKVGLELISRYGPTTIKEALCGGLGCRPEQLFWDCKLNDIPNTVAGAARAVVEHGFGMFNVHALGGTAMMRAAKDAAPGTIVLGVTLLTSLGVLELKNLGLVPDVDDAVAKEMITEVVLKLACDARSAGLDGVIASAQEAAAIREMWPDALIVTPAIRFAEEGHGDQKRVCTPGEAVKNGADAIVMGRSITGSGNPSAAAERAIAEIRESIVA